MARQIKKAELRAFHGSLERGFIGGVPDNTDDQARGGERGG
jgi:hypothetical protein